MPFYSQLPVPPLISLMSINLVFGLPLPRTPKYHTNEEAIFYTVVSADVARMLKCLVSADVARMLKCQKSDFRSQKPIFFSALFRFVLCVQLILSNMQ